MANYDDLLEEITSNYSEAELTQVCKALNKTYNIYDSEDYRWEQIRYILPKTTDAQIEKLREMQLSNMVVNDLIMKHYICERVVKYYLIKHLMPLSNHIVAFEMCIGNSRVDICRINGGSYAYEIKTEYDSFDRLGTQMKDYLDSFEKVYLVVPYSMRSAALSAIPSTCGLITYRLTEAGMLFSYYRKAQINKCSINKCAASLSSTDLASLLRLLHHKTLPAHKDERLEVASNTSPSQFWSAYKKLLKTKYSAKWAFLTEHFSEILPIDVQNFFSTSIDPQLTYSKREAEQ